jgi:hypothetical protein
VKEVVSKERPSKFIIFTDSNGREITEERVKCHMPPGKKREETKLEVSVVYTLLEICQKLLGARLMWQGRLES